MSADPWPRVRLGELVEVRHGFAFPSRDFATDGPGDYVVLTPGNFHEQGGFKYEPDKAKRYARRPDPKLVLAAGDLIVAMTAQSPALLGAPALVPEDDRFLHNQRIGHVVARPGAPVDRGFLYHLLHGDELRARLRASATGTKVRHTAPSRIEALEIELPPLPIQRRAAAILGAHDELIAVHERRMVLAEEAVRHLLARFVEHGRSASSGPGRVTLGELAERRSERADPRALDPATPCIGLEHIPRRRLVIERWARAGDSRSRKLGVAPGDLLFARIRPYFHKVALSPVAGLCSADAFVLRPREPGLRALVVALVSDPRFVAHASRTAKPGANMPRADWSAMAAYPLRLPAELERFAARVDPLLELLEVLARAKLELAAARDALRPRLLLPP